MTKSTVFKEVPNWKGYRISNFGELQSCRRNDGRIGRLWHTKFPGEDSDGYLRVKLHSKGKTWFVGIHHLVLLAFKGSPLKGCLALHKDGNRKNNELTNLYWGTPQSNADDRDCHGNTAKHERNGNAFISMEDAQRIRKIRAKTGIAYSKLGKIFGLSKRQAMRICKGEHWVEAPTNIPVHRQEVFEAMKRDRAKDSTETTKA